MSGKRKTPEKLFVRRNEDIDIYLIKQFEEVYKNNFTDEYLEDVIEGRKIEEKNKKEIEEILWKYNSVANGDFDEGSVEEKKVGSLEQDNPSILQKGFDIFRSKNSNFIDDNIRIQDVLYYCIKKGVDNLDSLELFELLLSFCSAKYVFEPDVEYKKNYSEKQYSNSRIKNALVGIMEKKDNVKKERKMKNIELGKEYDKYKKGEIDIDDIKIIILKKDLTIENFKKMPEVKLLKLMSKKIEESYKKDENNVRKYPLTRRFLDNLLIEFIKVQSGFKDSEEEKYFDGHNHKDSNILRNHLLWYDEKYSFYGGMEIINKNGYMFNALMNIGKDLNITSVLNYWIGLKHRIRTIALENISSLIVDNYGDYADEKMKNKDEKIIKGHFKTGKNLRDYASEENATDLYSFYLEFYDLNNNIEPKDTMYVNQNAVLFCTHCGGPLKFNSIKQQEKYLGGVLQATINDVDIVPIGNCTCSPAPDAIWEETKKDKKIGGVSALLSDSKLQCSKGGEIRISNPGQNKEGIANTRDIEIIPSNRKRSCTYNNIKIVCNDICNSFLYTDLKDKCIEYKKAKEEIEKQSAVNEKKESGIDDKVKNKKEDLKKEKMIKILSFKASEDVKARLIKEIEKNSTTAGLKSLEYVISKKDQEKYDNYEKFPNLPSLGTIIGGYLMEAMGLGNTELSENLENNVIETIMETIAKRNEKSPFKGEDYITGNYNIKNKLEEQEVKPIEIVKNRTIGEELYKEYGSSISGEDIMRKLVK